MSDTTRPQDRDPNDIMAAARQKLRRQRLTVPITPCAPRRTPAPGVPLTGTERGSDGEVYAWVTYPCTCKDPNHAWTAETEPLRQAWY